VCAEKLDTSEGQVPVTMSMGLIVYDQLVDNDAKALLRDTDAALYRAKKAGRNQIVVVGDEPPAAPAP